MRQNRSGFTMIELVMVIVVLGILASIASSKMSVTRDDAMMTKGRSDIATIRSAISLKRSTNMMTGKGLNPKFLDDAAYVENEDLFDGNATSKLLDYPILSKDKNGGWMKTSQQIISPKKTVSKYDFKFMGKKIEFVYDSKSGSFDCNHTANNKTLKEYCNNLTH